MFGNDPKKYVNEGFALTRDLIRRFSLPDWVQGRPETSETDRIYLDLVMGAFIESSNAEAQRNGAETLSYHPELWAVIERSITDCALQIEALENLNVEVSWETQVSLYLKAWASGLNPWAMIGVAAYLRHVGHVKEAKRALDVCALFFRYWQSLPAQQQNYMKLSYATIRVYVRKVSGWGIKDVGQSRFEHFLDLDIRQERAKF